MSMVWIKTTDADKVPGQEVILYNKGGWIDIGFWFEAVGMWYSNCTGSGGDDEFTHVMVAPDHPRA